MQTRIYSQVQKEVLQRLHRVHCFHIGCVESASNCAQCSRSSKKLWNPAERWPLATASRFYMTCGLLRFLYITLALGPPEHIL